AMRLAPFKVPSRVLFVEELPRGPTGKLQRIGLAERLSLMAPELAQPVTHTGLVAPRTLIEELLAGLGAQVLNLERGGRHDNFFQAGGDSLLATQLLARVRDALHVEPPLLAFFETPTVAGLAKSIEAVSQAESGLPALCPVPRDGALPLSYDQQ